MEHLGPYIPIALMLLFAAGFGIVSLVMGSILGPKRPNPDKMLPYESGMKPIGDANVRVPIKFYMVSLLFLLFDIEAIFVITWAILFQGKQLDFESGALAFTQEAFQRFAFAEMFVFVAILMVGYAYVWRKGAFRWT